MGLKCSLDFVQETMENIFRNVEDAEVYINLTGGEGRMHLSMQLPKPVSNPYGLLHTGIRAIGK